MLKLAKSYLGQEILFLNKLITHQNRKLIITSGFFLTILSNCKYFFHKKWYSHQLHEFAQIYFYKSA